MLCEVTQVTDDADDNYDEPVANDFDNVAIGNHFFQPFAYDTDTIFIPQVHSEIVYVGYVAKCTVDCSCC